MIAAVTTAAAAAAFEARPRSFGGMMAAASLNDVAFAEISHCRDMQLTSSTTEDMPCDRTADCFAAPANHPLAIGNRIEKSLGLVLLM